MKRNCIAFLKRIAASTKEKGLGRAQGDVTADGTHASGQRPSEKTQGMIYSGKKKRFTLSQRRRGGNRDITQGSTAGSMARVNTMSRKAAGRSLMIPHKRSKNMDPGTAEQKEHNHLVNSTRVRVEHSIGRLKRYARLRRPVRRDHKPVQP